MVCEHPRVIRNPKVGKLLQSFPSVINNVGRVIYYHLEGMPVSSLWKKVGIPTLENARDFALFDPETGATEPLFYVVPCGKCILCRNRKKKELAARAILEGNQYDYPPLFLTFTYNDKHLPEGNELDRRAMPLFLKRLRSRLDNYNIRHQLAYMYCGEYGTKFGRAHYHMVLWNFPQDDAHFPNIMGVIRFIERCWSVFVMKERDNGKMMRVHKTVVRNGKPVKLYYPSGRPIYETEPIGIIQVKPVNRTDGCISYVTKYMRKQSSKFPDHKQQPFYYAASQRRGIGSAGIKDLAAFIKANPDLTAVQVRDKFTGRTENLPITSYVKEKVWQSYSTLLRNKELETVREFYCERENFLQYSTLLRHRLGINNYKLRSYQNEEGHIITEKYYDDPYLDFNSSWHPSWQKAYKHTAWYVKNSKVRDFEEFENNKVMVSDDWLWQYLAASADRLTILSAKILDTPDINELSLQREQELKQRSLTLQALYGNAPEQNASVLADKLRANEQRSQHREVF